MRTLLALVLSIPSAWATSAPTITPGGIVPIYSSSTTIQPGEWVSIYGMNLASATATWTGDFPTSLGGTSVTIDGKPAYLWLVSPGQINLQAPDDTATGTVPVVVTTAAGSATATVTLGKVAPSFCLLDSTHVTGIILRTDGSGTYGGGTYDILGPSGTSLGYQTVAAKAGDSVVIYGVGFGSTIPAVPSGQAYSGAAATVNPVTLIVNGQPVNPTFAGLSGAGLYQFNFIVPAVSPGSLTIQAIVTGVTTQSGPVMAVESGGTAPQLKSLSVTPASLTGGQSATGSVFLTAPSLAGGSIVSVASSPSNLASVPATVTIPAGASSGTFTISTSQVTANQLVGIGVAYDGLTAATTFTITPPNILWFNYATIPGTLLSSGQPAANVMLSTGAIRLNLGLNSVPPGPNTTVNTEIVGISVIGFDEAGFDLYFGNAFWNGSTLSSSAISSAPSIFTYGNNYPTVLSGSFSLTLPVGQQTGTATGTVVFSTSQSQTYSAAFTGTFQAMVTQP